MKEHTCICGWVYQVVTINFIKNISNGFISEYWNNRIGNWAWRPNDKSIWVADIRPNSCFNNNCKFYIK